MDIVVISLVDATEQRGAVLQQLSGLGVAFEFFDAIPGAVADPACSAHVSTARSSLG